MDKICFCILFFLYTLDFKPYNEYIGQKERGNTGFGVHLYKENEQMYLWNKNVSVYYRISNDGNITSSIGGIRTRMVGSYLNGPRFKTITVIVNTNKKWMNFKVNGEYNFRTYRKR